MLIESGYVDVIKIRKTLVAQPGRARMLHETEPEKEALEEIRTPDLRFTKPSLCQAELLGQNKGNSSSTLFNASR